jgi:hypothetical protein
MLPQQLLLLQIAVQPAGARIVPLAAIVTISILLYCLLALLHSFITAGTVYDESGVCCCPGQFVLV